MIYSVALTIPANTSIFDPFTQNLILTRGTIHQLDIEFPSGCAGLVGIRILKGSFQIFPSNPSGSFQGDDTRISFKEDYKLLSEPYLISLLGHNTDDTYEHTIQIRIGLLRFIDKKITDWDDLGLIT